MHAVPAIAEQPPASASARGAQATWAWHRFVARARAVQVGRAIALALLLALLLVPGWARSLGIAGSIPWILLAAGAASTLLNGLLLRRDRVVESTARSRRLLRATSWSSLCLDTLCALYLIAATGGLRSPLLALQLGLVGAFALLFPRPLAAVPALLLLPLLARIDRLLDPAAAGGPFEILAILGYGGLDLAIILLLVEADRQGEAHHERLLRLERVERELAVAKERGRLSREMHDGLGASLTSLALQSEILLGRCPDGRFREEVAELRSGTSEALEELRHGLRLMRGEFRLGAAARSHCEQLRRRIGVDLRFEGDDHPAADLADAAALHLFRLLQEAVSNAVRHAAASRIEVRLEAADGVVSLSVRDDGKGFESSSVGEGHYGLRGMQERASRCGGSLELRSAAGLGTEVRAVVPIRSPSPPAGRKEAK